LLFAALALLNWLRWFMRSLQLATADYESPVIADFVYGIVLAAGSSGLVSQHQVNTVNVVSLQIVASAASLLAFGRGTGVMLHRSWMASLTEFRDSFSRHGRWALAGVLSTEATSNAHAYALTLAVGPAAFAPLAAVALYFRPVGVVLLALTQFERPRMASYLQLHAHAKLRAAVRMFRSTSLLVSEIHSWCSAPPF
jgi:hypothetical protein